MYRMRYEIRSPADYDMDIIRLCAAPKGSGTFSCPGLGLKAYLISTPHLSELERDARAWLPCPFSGAVQESVCGALDFMP